VKRTPLVRKTPMNRSKGIRTMRGVPASQVLTFVDEAAQMDLSAAADALANRQRSVEQGSPTWTGEVETSQRAPKPTRTGFAPVTRQIILERDRYACVRCGIPVDTSSVGYSLQHRDNRGMGGTTDPSINLPSNGIVLCGSGTTGCHGWVESHPDEATGNGWAVLAWADPITVPVRYRHGWYLLDRRGGMQVIADGIIPDNGAHTIAKRKGLM
jgi:hypothetical protein